MPIERRVFDERREKERAWRKGVLGVSGIG